MDIGTAFTVAEAATELSVSHSRVRYLIIHGQLNAERFGNQWAIPRSEIQRICRQPRTVGRPWKPERAWQLIESVTSGDAPFSELETNAGKMCRRSTCREYLVSRHELEWLVADSRTVIGGDGEPTGDTRSHVYVAAGDLDIWTRTHLCGDRRLGEAAALVVVHSAPTIPTEDRFAPLAARWLDLSEDGRSDAAEQLKHSIVRRYRGPWPLADLAATLNGTVEWTSLRTWIDHLRQHPATTGEALAAAPTRSGDLFFDNLIAGIAEHEADLARLCRPQWTADVPALLEPRLSVGTPRMQAAAEATAPRQFLDRNIRLGAANLWRNR